MKKILGFIATVGVLSFVTSFISTDAKAQDGSRERQGLRHLVTTLEADVAEQKAHQERTELEMLALKLSLAEQNNSEEVNELLDRVKELERKLAEAEENVLDLQAEELKAKETFAKGWQNLALVAKFFSNLPDEDGDGVPDLFDLCPEEAGSGEYFGCIEPRPDAYSDMDRDGFPTYMDLCPEVKGTYFGCTNDVITEDSDGDEIPDLLDGCPYMAGPFENAGCPVIE